MRTAVIVVSFSGLLAVALLLLLGPNGHPQISTINEPEYKGDPVDMVITSQSLDGAVLDTQVGSSTTLTLASDVFFDFDKATLTTNAVADLDSAAVRLRSSGVAKARIDGHTDALGAVEYNRDLSRRRAEAVRDALAPKLPGTDLETAGHGDSQSVAGNESEEGRAKNRRVAISFG